MTNTTREKIKQKFRVHATAITQNKEGQEGYVVTASNVPKLLDDIESLVEEEIEMALEVHKAIERQVKSHEAKYMPTEGVSILSIQETEEGYEREELSQKKEGGK